MPAYKFRSTWSGLVTLTADHRSDVNATVTAGDDVSASWPSDGSMMFNGALLTARDQYRLRRRTSGRTCQVDTATDIWKKAVAGAKLEIEKTEEVEGKTGPVFLMHSNDKKLVVNMDAHKLALCQEVGQVATWRASDASSAIVGYTLDETPACILMPLRPVS